MPVYKVMGGVHRCVAARLAGLTEIRAQIDDADGNLGPVVPIPLSELYSPKAEIGRWDRGRDLYDLVRLFADPATRETVPAVELLEVSDWLAKYLTRVADVVVKPA
jgi:hypothetical protein